MRIDFKFSQADLVDAETEEMKEKMEYFESSKEFFTIADYFYEVTLSSLMRIHNFLFFLALVISLFVWLLMEKTTKEYAQSIYFFLGAYL
jgi:ABC-type uncharacterized transport system permease subunit